MITGNRGEWSEIYALFKLLGDKELHLGDKNIEKLTGFVYPIIEILRVENEKSFSYNIQDEIIFITGPDDKLSIPVQTFKENATKLFEIISNSKTRTFEIPEIEHFMRSINCFKLKADSTKKTDIRIVIHDPFTNQRPILGFSLKSQLGSPSTILNAGKTTNFIYKIYHLKLTEKEITKINSINTRSKIKDRLEEIEKRGGVLVFHETVNSIFSNNLILIDSLLPNILSEIVKEFFTSKLSRLTELVDTISAKNPNQYDKSNNHKYYEYKIKRLLTDAALGMMAGSVWSGKYDATGGFLIIKENGDVLCYHIYNKNEFEDYLLNNTKLETASSSRHEFGELYLKEDNLYFNLNLQIRFIK